MKILAIRGKNLASLDGEFEIDFTIEPLKSAGIFAITGSTGSGKSTLLDALCLALFDDTPRTNMASENNIQIVDVKDKTINQKDSRNILRRGTSDGYAEVDFVSLGGEIFRSRWSVRRSRDKIDGLLQSSELRLINIVSNVEVQGRKTELLAKIVELIGLTFYQFTRAVLLAQGDFATFLKATQKEKAELLEKLTGTEIYSRISTLIYEKSKIAEQELNLLKERIKDVEILSGENFNILAAEKVLIVHEVKAVQNEVTILTEKLKWIVDDEVLRNSVNGAEQILANSQNAIEQAKPRYDKLAQIDSVQEIRDTFNESELSKMQLANSKLNLAKQELGRNANAVLLKHITEKFAICEAEQISINEAIAKLEPQIRLAGELDVKLLGVKLNVAEAKKELDLAVEVKVKLDNDIKLTNNNIAQTNKSISAVNLWFNENKYYKEIVPRIDLIISLLYDAAATHMQGNANAKLLADSKVIMQSDISKLAYLQSEAERLNNILPAEIANLRAKLEDGVPCPVCGSLHHPLSNFSGGSLDEGELVKAKKEVNDSILLLTASIEKLKEEHIRLQSMIDSYAAQYVETIKKLDGYLTGVPLWREEFKHGALQKRLVEVVDKWRKYEEWLVVANEKINSLEATVKLWQENVIVAASTFDLREQKYNQYVLEFNKFQKERSELLGGRSVVEVEKEYAQKRRLIIDNMAKVTGERDIIRTKNEKYLGIITERLGEIESLTERCTVLQNEIEKWILSKNNVVTMEQLAQLLLNDREWLVGEREALGKLNENRISAEATLAERRKIVASHYKAEIKPLDGEEKEGLQSVLNNKSELYKQKNARNTEIEIIFANHIKGMERIKLFEKELEQKNILAENWKKLSDMFGSADGSKFKVLAQGYTLDALLSYANKHLHELSKRYELQRIPGTLALQVADLDMLGEVRTVHSLSGGESFLISLALALGLSSLSSNRMKVESLFIDEGFGSLDIDTLRVAMDALERLQTQGRKIGVISHVAEMTERIATQIRVVKTVNGKSSIIVS